MIRRAAKRCLYKEDETIPQKKGRKKKVHSFVFLAVFSIRAVKRCKEKFKKHWAHCIKYSSLPSVSSSPWGNASGGSSSPPWGPSPTPSGPPSIPHLQDLVNFALFYPDIKISLKFLKMLLKERVNNIVAVSNTVLSLFRAIQKYFLTLRKKNFYSSPDTPRKTSSFESLTNLN